MRCLAVCAFAMEGIVKRELTDLGFADARCDQGCVRFSADWEGIFRANLWLRCADRVLILLGEGRTETFEDLFQLTLNCGIGDLLPPDAAFPVKGKCARSALMSVRDCQAIVKKAAAQSMCKKHRMNWCPETGAVFQLEAAIHGDVCRITLDTSGEALNKRGYRTWTGEAPIRETLAAAILRLSPWRPDSGRDVLYDPCCGTGTFLIEAAMMQSHRAPGLRRRFAMEAWHFCAEVQALRTEAEEIYDPSLIHDISGSDISPEAVGLCWKHIEQAGLKGRIHAEVKDLRTLTVDPGPGRFLTFIANPPYGERMGEIRDAEKLYADMRALWDRSPGSRMTVITSCPSFERIFRRRALKKTRFYNGRLECECLFI